MKLFTQTLILFVSFFALQSCAGKKVVSNSGTGPASNPVVEANELLSDSEIPFTWFAGSGQGKLDWDDQNVSVRFKVRIYRDSLIWVQIQKLGFEVGRMLVRQDSSFIINRLEKSYSVFYTPDFFAEYNLPPDFTMFKRAFTGGAFVPSGNNKVTTENGMIVVRNDNGSKVTYTFNEQKQLTGSVAIDKWQREWNSGYADYRIISDSLTIPFTRNNLLTMGGESYVLDLMYDEILVNTPQEMPFSIPSHYEKL